MASNPLPGVPRLTGTDNVGDWLLAIKGYLGIHKGLRNFLGLYPEPYRKTDGPHFEGAHAGLSPPDATRSTSGCKLTDSELDRWETWSEHELLALGAILLTVEPWLAKRLDKLYSASQMREEILKEYNTETHRCFRTAMYELEALILPSGPSIQQMKDHLRNFRNALCKVEGAKVTLSESEKTFRFLMSLPLDIRTNTRIESYDPDDKPFAGLATIFTDYIQSLYLNAVLDDTRRRQHGE